MSEVKFGFSEDSVSVLIVEDHALYRAGFRAACTEYNFDLVAEADTVDGCLSQLAKTKCSVAVLDLSLGDGSSITENVAKLRERNIEVVVHSIGDRRTHVAEALKAGAATIITKAQTMEKLAQAIYLVAHGVLINNVQTTAAIDADLEFKNRVELSARELQVLRMYASGFTQKQIAYDLQIAQSTVKEHIDRIRAKYADVQRLITDKTDFLRRGIEDGYIDDVD